MRGLAVAILLALGALGAAPTGAQELPTIRMGVRVDTPPFAWRDEANDSYLGFLVDLCVDAATRAGYPFVQTPIEAADRLDVFAGRRSDLDLLCDPTTITLARMGDFAALPGPVGLEFGPIVFVANGAYVTNGSDGAGVMTEAPADPDACLGAPASRAAPAEQGAAEVATDAQGAAEIATDAAPATERLAAGFVVGATSRHVLAEALRDGRLPLQAGQMVCPVEMETHWDAARAFCAGALRYYFGDQDIVRSALEKTAAEAGACDFEPAARPLSYEPYALVISSRTPGFRQAFVKALYEVFHHQTAEHRFSGNFEGRTMSPFLETLFRINRVPEGVPSAEDRARAEAGGGGDQAQVRR